MAYKAKNCMDPPGFAHLGVVGDKGPEGEQGPPGHVPMYELGKTEPTWIPSKPSAEESTSPKIQLPAEAKAAGKGISLQDIITSKKVAATETGAVVLMPQEFDADNVKAYIQQEIEAGIKEHQTALLRKVADVLAEEITKERSVHEANYNKLARTMAALENNINYRFGQATELDKERVLAIAELKSKVLYLENMLEEKAQETKMLRSKLHAVSISKPVRKVKRRKYDSQGQDTPKPGAGG